MKKIILGMLCWGMAFSASAQSLDYLTFRTAQGGEVSLPVDGLKITFEGANLHAEVLQKKVDFRLQDLNCMFFATTPTAIEKVEANSEEVAIVNGRVVVKSGSTVAVDVYTLDGRSVAGEGLTKGIYLVKVNGRTLKLMAR